LQPRQNQALSSELRCDPVRDRMIEPDGLVAIRGALRFNSGRSERPRGCDRRIGGRRPQFIAKPVLGVRFASRGADPAPVRGAPWGVHRSQSADGGNVTKRLPLWRGSYVDVRNARRPMSQLLPTGVTSRPSEGAYFGVVRWRRIDLKRVIPTNSASSFMGSPIQTVDISALE
jgi:hypothetical protein